MTVKTSDKHECNCDHSHCKPNVNCGNSGGGAVYGLGIFGAAFYFFPLASDFSGYAMAILKSLVWPAMLVYQALSLLQL